jgi:acetyl esterase/lipase
MRFLLLGLAPFLIAAAAAQQAAPERPFQEARDAPPPPAGITPLIAPPTVRGIEPANSYGPQKIAFSDGVSGVFDLTYATLPGYRPLTLDLYSPPPGAGPLPLVVFVHGGGWNGGDARHAGTFEDFPAQLAALAAQGYVVASVNYRLSEEAHFPAPLQDVKAAIRWLRAGAAGRNIDITRVAVWGAGWTLLGAEDVNKDGFSDLLWQNTTTGTVAVQQMTTGATTLGALTALTTPPAGTFHLVASTGGG